MRPGARRVHSGSYDLFSCALAVVWFIRIRSVHSRAPWASLGSVGPVRFISLCPRGRSVHSRAPKGSSVSFDCVRFITVRPVVVGFIRVRSVHSPAPWGSSGSFGPFPCDVGVVGFIRLCLVHSCAPWVSSVSLGFVWSIPLRT